MTDAPSMSGGEVPLSSKLCAQLESYRRPSRRNCQRSEVKADKQKMPATTEKRKRGGNNRPAETRAVPPCPSDGEKKDKRRKKEEESEPREKSKVDDQFPAEPPDGANLVHFQNTLGHQYNYYISDEVRDEVKKLDAQARGGVPVRAAQLKCLTSTALEMLLKYNDRPAYQMTKTECAAMVAEYINHGCPPRCPCCQRGALRFSNGRKKYGKKYFWCPGSTTNGQNYYGCGFRANRDQVERNPWKCP